MAAQYLLMENGDRFLTEDGNDLLILEEEEETKKVFVQLVYEKRR